MKYLNPPIVELWIGFQFSPLQSADWSELVWKKFVKDSEEFNSEPEFYYERKFFFRKEKNGGAPAYDRHTDRLDHVKLSISDVESVVITNDRFTYNVATKADRYPGFQVIAANAARFYAELSKVMGTASGCAVHATDHIAIPTASGFELNEYFQFDVTLPKGAVQLGYLDLSTILVTESDRQVGFSFRTLYSESLGDITAFEMKWQHDQKITSENELSIQMLTESWQTICDLFEGSLTEKTRNLFQLKA